MRDVLEPVPTAPPAAPPQQIWYPPPVQPPPRVGSPLSAGAIMGLLGLIISVLLFVGLVTYHATFLIPIPSTFNPPPSTPELTAYIATIRTLGWISIVAMDLAVSLTVMIAWIVGGMKGEQPESMRRGVFLFASVFLTVWLFFSFFAYAIFRSLLPFP